MSKQDNIYIALMETLDKYLDPHENAKARIEIDDLIEKLYELADRPGCGEK